MTLGLPEGEPPAPSRDMSLPRPRQPSPPPVPRHRGSVQAGGRLAARLEQRPRSLAMGQSRADRGTPEDGRRVSLDRGGLAARRSPPLGDYSAPDSPGGSHASPPRNPGCVGQAPSPGARRFASRPTPDRERGDSTAPLRSPAPSPSARSRRIRLKGSHRNARWPAAAQSTPNLRLRRTF